MKYLVVLTLIFSSLVMAEVRIGVLNYQKVIMTTKEGKRVYNSLKKTFDTRQKTVKAKETELKKMQDDFRKQSALLSAKAKSKKMQEIREKANSVRELTMRYQQEVNKSLAEKRKPIFKKLEKIIETVSQAEKLDFAIEISASPLVYAKNPVDITDKVIKAYDAKYK